tara:strand:- start:936 stop:1235 length:300 start_codon:yes stop_codon:yes gene_type:complete
MLRAFKVSGSSMEPTLRTDDIVVVLKKKNISVNDIVVVKDSEYGFLIKRLEKFEKNGIKLSSDNKNSFSPATKKIYDISNIVGKYVFKINAKNLLCKLF